MSLALLQLESLGLCEHCGELVSTSSYAHEGAMNATWHCVCGGELTHASFGYDKGSGGAKKVRWVGPDGKWTESKPLNDFRLNGVEVITRMHEIWR